MNEADRAVVEDIDGELEAVEQRLLAIKVPGEKLDDAASVEAWEQEAEKLAQRLSDLRVAQELQATLTSEAHREREEIFGQSVGKRYRWEGWREVTVRMTHGTPVRLKVRYASRRSGNWLKRRRRGLYPGLVLPGIYEHCTPARAAEVAKPVVAMGSPDEAERHLRSHGQAVERWRMLRVTREMGRRARLVAQAQGIAANESVAGRRVVVAMDGGRMRIRHPKRGRRRRSGRHGYDTPWKESWLLIVYVVDDKGRPDKRFSPWIDGTLRGPDVLFARLEGYLRGLGPTQADRLLFVADGAPRIRKRVQTLRAHLGLGPERALEAVSFYHAVEHLAAAAKETAWSEPQRRIRIREQSRALRRGRVGMVIDALDRLRRGRRRNTALNRERDYFARNRERMRYARLKARHLPIGSGAVESAVRRVINLRLKGASLFWNWDAAEEMLMLRSFYKAGRWNILTKLAFSPSHVVAA
jgi:hypothetical protein